MVATTYDPATPYRGALRLVRDLGNARLITMRGDGHTAYGGESACIDAAVEAYVNTLTLPAEGTSCTQDTPFEPLAAFAKAKAATAADDRRVVAGRVPHLTKKLEHRGPPQRRASAAGPVLRTRGSRATCRPR